MSQSKKGSLVEAFASTLVGLAYAFSLNMLIAAAYGFPMTAKYSAILTFWMTVASIVRTYCIRRIAEWLPRAWRQWRCQHRFGFVDTCAGELIQECAYCEKRVRDFYPSAE